MIIKTPMKLTYATSKAVDAEAPLIHGKNNAYLYINFLHNDVLNSLIFSHIQLNARNNNTQKNTRLKDI